MAEDKKTEQPAEGEAQAAGDSTRKRKKINGMTLGEIEAKLAEVKEKQGGLTSSTRSSSSSGKRPCLPEFRSSLDLAGSVCDPCRTRKIEIYIPLPFCYHIRRKKKEKMRVLSKESKTKIIGDNRLQAQDPGSRSPDRPAERADQLPFRPPGLP